MDKTSFEWKTGIVAEMKLAARLKRDGCLVTQVRHGSDVAPMLRGWDRQYRLPDLQVWWPRTRQSGWLDSKWKSTSGVVQAMGGLRTTGIDRVDFDDYEAVERLTGHPVFLAFIHKAQDVVLLGDLHTHRVPSLGAGKVMVFWDMAKLARLCSYQELMETTAAAQGIGEPLFVPPESAPTQLSLFDGVA